MTKTDNQWVKKILFYSALSGWGLSLIITLLSLADFDVEGKVSFIQSLHIGIFVVWIPTILILRKDSEFQESYRSKQSEKIFLGSYKLIFKRTPNWLTIIAISGILCALVSFILDAFTNGTGTPIMLNGQYVLYSHGNILQTLTEKEYCHYKAVDMRSWSTLWMAFYGMAVALLFTFIKKGNTNSNKTELELE